MAAALGLVIAVEQTGESGIEGPMIADMIAQHERSEEPGRVGELPFGGRGIGMRLDRRIGIA